MEWEFWAQIIIKKYKLHNIVDHSFSRFKIELDQSWIESAVIEIYFSSIFLRICGNFSIFIFTKVIKKFNANFLQNRKKSWCKFAGQDEFVVAFNTVLAWLDRGECCSKKSNSVYNLLVTCNAQLKRLQMDREECIKKMTIYRQQHALKLQAFSTQCKTKCQISSFNCKTVKYFVIWRLFLWSTFNVLIWFCFCILVSVNLIYFVPILTPRRKYDPYCLDQVCGCVTISPPSLRTLSTYRRILTHLTEFAQRFLLFKWLKYFDAFSPSIGTNFYRGKKAKELGSFYESTAKKHWALVAANWGKYKWFV